MGRKHSSKEEVQSHELGSYLLFLRTDKKATGLVKEQELKYESSCTKKQDSVMSYEPSETTDSGFSLFNAEAVGEFLRVKLLYLSDIRVTDRLTNRLFS